MEAKFEAQLESARRQIQKVAQGFDLKYCAESYSFLFVSKRESCLRNYLAAPMYSEFGTTAEERIQNLEKFLSSQLYAQVTGPGSTEGCVTHLEELQEERAVIPLIANPALRAEYEALYDKLEHEQRMQGRWLTLLSQPQNEEEFRGLEYTVLHEWLHVLLMDNGISFQDVGKSWELDEGLVSYLMAFLGKEDLDAKLEEIAQQLERHHEVMLEAARRWRDLLKGSKTPKERKEAILKVLRE